MNKRHYEHTLPNIRGSLSNTYGKDHKTLSVCRNGVQMAQIGTGINLCHLRHLHSK